ncbi:MAG: alpha/beta hydrolase [Bacteroidales bacterium]|nr:alpha/beta hydrolase [Bacteroidales bacterium]
MRKIIFSLLAAFLAMPLFAQAPQAGNPMQGRAQAPSYITIKLWPDGAPNSNGLEGEERELWGGRIGNITDPELLVYPAKEPNGLAVIMCPGGGYNYVATTHEGTDMADWFNSLGVTFAVLKYRMPNGHCDVPLTDGLRAMELMRSRSSEWGFTKLGIMGGSAGGHLASSVAVHYNSPLNRPDFQILLYPLITTKGRFAPGRGFLLLGKDATQEQADYYSSELHVTPDCPPAFIAHSFDDSTVPISDSMDYASALYKNKVPVSLHIYPEGEHGWGFKDSFKYKRDWTGELEKWLIWVNGR